MRFSFPHAAAHGRTKKGNCPHRAAPTAGERLPGKRGEAGYCSHCSPLADPGHSDSPAATKDHATALIRSDPGTAVGPASTSADYLSKQLADAPAAAQAAGSRKRRRTRSTCSAGSSRPGDSLDESRAETGNGADQRPAASRCRDARAGQHDQDAAAPGSSDCRHARGARCHHFPAAPAGRDHFPPALLGAFRDVARDFSDSNLELRRIVGNGQFRYDHSGRGKF